MSYCEDDPRYQLCKVCGAKDCDCTMGDLVALRDTEIATLKRKLEFEKREHIEMQKYTLSLEKGIAELKQQNAELLKDAERCYELLDDAVNALANYRTLQRHTKDRIGAEVTDKFVKEINAAIASAEGCK